MVHHIRHELRHPRALQVKAGGAAAARARREVRLAVVRSAEVVACTLSSAGGDLLGLVTENAAGSQPCPLFNALIIDEVSCRCRLAGCMPAGVWGVIVCAAAPAVSFL